MAIHFTGDIFKCIFVNEKFYSSIWISLKFVPKGPIASKSVLVQIMAWCLTGDTPLSEPILTQFTAGSGLFSHRNDFLGTSKGKYWVWWTKSLSIIRYQIAKFMGPTWGPPGSCRPQMGPMLAPWTLLPGVCLSGFVSIISNAYLEHAIFKVAGILSRPLNVDIAQLKNWLHSEDSFLLHAAGTWHDINWLWWFAI